MALKRRDALRLTEDIDDIYVSKGKQVVHIDMKKEKPDTDTLIHLLLRPTGNLRAPTLKKGRKLIVGFDEPTYKKVFGTS